MLAESFEDIDFTIDGLTKTHSDRGALWITAYKTNGEPFVCPKDECFLLPCTLYVRAEGLTLDMSDEENIFYTYTPDLTPCEINDDGTLSILLDNIDWQEDTSEVYLGFGDMIRVKRDDYYTLGEDIEKLKALMTENGKVQFPDGEEVYSALTLSLSVNRMR